MNKKAQFEHPIAIFFFLVIGLLVFAPIMLKIMNSVLTPFASGVGNISSTAGSTVTGIKTTFVSFWDFVIMSAFLINVILLFVSAFMVDTHPIFLVLYILFGFLIFIFAPMLLDSVDKIYDSADFTSEVSDIPMVDFIRNNFTMIVLGIYFISGIIIYAKIRSIG